MSMVKAFTTAVTKSAKVANILADTELATCPPPGGHYHVFGRHAASAGVIQLSARVAGKLVAEDLPINVEAGGPKKPDDHIITLDAAAGDPVIITLKEDGTCTTTPSIRIEFEELTAEEVARIQAAMEAVEGRGEGRRRRRRRRR